jgi:thiosulfate dehydrogenase
MALLCVLWYVVVCAPPKGGKPVADAKKTTEPAEFKAPDTATIPKNKDGEMIRYGRALIVNTSAFMGPNGSVAHITNGMNCQNCHLDAGTKAWGNNYFSVHATYPRFRDRSGAIETETKRVQDCMVRSLNGSEFPPESKELLAILAYLKWVGTNARIGEKVKTSGFKDMPYLQRAADASKGKVHYAGKCQQCHGADGVGMAKPGTNDRYPPLWGPGSYNDGAGMYRISNFAKYIKCNMPFGASHDNTVLTDEEAWDIAAFVNSQPRPHYDASHDWPDISKKPIDMPFGPYADGFTETQHKFGPFAAIEEARKKKEKKL